VEIGPIISEPDAAHQARNGMDVYTPRRRDALKLARSLFSNTPVEEPAHQPSFFPHFHPDASHPQFAFERGGRPRARTGVGHIFFGSRGENYTLKPSKQTPRT
jgi:hypothetical protein